MSYRSIPIQFGEPRRQPGGHLFGKLVLILVASLIGASLALYVSAMTMPVSPPQPNIYLLGNHQ